MAIILQKPPTFLESLLESTGIGISRGMQRYYKERDRKRGVTQTIIEGVLSGDISPEILATDLGQSYQRYLGIEDEPAIKQATQTGLEEAGYEERTVELPGGTSTREMPGARITMPGVTPPEIPFELYRKKEEQKKELVAQTEQRQELQLYRLKKQVDQDVKRMGRLSPEQRLGRLSDYMKAFERIGVDPKSATFNDPEAGITMTLPMKYQIEKDREAQRIKGLEGGQEFLKLEGQYHKRSASMIRTLTSIATGESVVDSAMRQAFAEGTVEKGYEKIVSRISQSSPRLQVQALLEPLNKELRSMHKRMRLFAKEAGISDFYLPHFESISPSQIFQPERYLRRKQEARHPELYSALSEGVDLEKKREPKPVGAVSLSAAGNVVVKPKPPGLVNLPTNDEYKELVGGMIERGWNKRSLESANGELLLQEAEKMGFDPEKIKKYFY